MNKNKGNSFIQINETESTNDYAKKIIDSGNVSNGTVINAISQIKGRGQAGNSWFSEKGKNIHCSIIFKPDFLALKQTFYLNMCFSLAVAETLNQYCNAILKWPNDIICNNKKLGGILIENSFTGNKFSWCVLGVGININNDNFPPELKNKAISLKIFNNLSYPSEEFSIIINRIKELTEKNFNQLKQGNFDKIKSAYLNNLIGYYEAIKLKSQLTQPVEIFNGKVTNVLDSGEIEILNLKNNLTKIYSFKEIEFLIY